MAENQQTNAHAALIFAHGQYLKTVLTSSTVGKRIDFLTRLFDSIAPIQENRKYSILKDLQAAYDMTGLNLPFLDAFCGYVLGHCQHVRVILSLTKVKLTSTEYNEWLGTRYNSKRTCDLRMADAKAFDTYLNQHDFTLWGEHETGVLIQQLYEIETKINEGEFKAVKQGALRLCELQAYILCTITNEESFDKLNNELINANIPDSSDSKDNNDTPVTCTTNQFLGWLKLVKGYGAHKINTILEVIRKCDNYLTQQENSGGLFNASSLNNIKKDVRDLQENYQEKGLIFLRKRMNRRILDLYINFLHDNFDNETGIEIEELVIGDSSCPHVTLGDSKTFHYAFRQWLTYNERKTEKAAREYASSLQTYCKYVRSKVTLPYKSVYECRRRCEIVQMLQSLSDPTWIPYFAKHPNACRTLNLFKKFIRTHHLNEMPDNSMAEKLQNLISGHFNGRVHSRLDDLWLLRLRSQWRQQFGAECLATDKQIKDVITSICVLDERDAPFYRLPETILSSSLLTAIRAFVDERLNRGIPYVQCTAIRERLHEQYPHEEIFELGENPDAAGRLLCNVLQKLCPDAYSFHKQEWVAPSGRRFITGEPTRDLIQRFNIYVKERVEMTGSPVSLAELQQHFDYVESKKVSQELCNRTPCLLGISGGLYVHYESFGFSDEDLNYFKRLIVTKLQNHPDGLTKSKIFKMAQEHCSQFFESPDYDELKDLLKNSANFCKALKAYWHEDAVLAFTGTMISLKGKKPKSIKDRYVEYAKRSPKFMLDDLKSLGNGGVVSQYLRDVRKYAVRIDEKQFVAKECVNFPIEKVDAALGRLFVQRTVYGIAAIRGFLDFPSVDEYQWNVFLLQSFLFTYSHSYVLLLPSECVNECTGIIAAKSGCIQSFEEALAKYLQEEGIDIHAPESEIRSILEERKIIGSKRGNGYLGLGPVLDRLRNC